MEKVPPLEMVLVSGGSTRYAVYATAYPAIEPCVACVLHLARLERAVARTSRFTCLPHGHHRLDRRDTSHAGKPTNKYSLLKGLVDTVAAVLYLYIL